MPVNTVELREKRHKLIVDARAILDKADKDDERRSLTSEERTEYDRIMVDADAAKSEIEDAERRNDLERTEAADHLSQEEEKRRANAEKDEEGAKLPLTVEEQRWAFRGEEEYRDAFAGYLTRGKSALGDDERRALTAGTGTEGGYLYASEQFAEELIQNVTDATIIRQLANVLPPLLTADSIGNPTLTSRMSDAEWTSELGVASRDEDLKFGRRNLTPHPLAKEVVMSAVLLRKVPKSETIVRDELGRVVSEANENGFLTGDGVQKPLGMFVAHEDGITTARDVSSGNTQTVVKFDGLKAAKYSIKQVYWSALQWIFHRNVMETIAKLKDGNGRYLLQDSVVQGEPDRMLSFPVRMSEFAPNTQTAGQYVGILGDYKNYWIVDALTMQIVRADELFVRTNQVLFIIRMETDGAPVREEAFARVKLAP